MKPRLVTPFKRPNSAVFWFRLVVPPRYRQALGKTEIRKSLETTDIGEARRLCIVRQDEWLKRFAAIDVELSAREAQQGIVAVDRFLERQAAEMGGMDRAISFELQSLALAELGFIDAVSAEDLGLAPGERHPLVETVYPGYRKRDERRMIDFRRSVLATTAAAVVPGYEAIDRAASLGFDEIAHGAIEEAFEHAGLDVDAADPRFTAAARYLFDRLRDYHLPDVELHRQTFPTPDPIAPLNASGGCGRSGPEISQASPEPQPSPVIADQNQLELRKRILSTAASARTLSEVFESWASEQPKEAAKLVDEWRVAIRRFVELFGDRDVADIEPDLVADFREAMKRLPARPAHDVRALPIIEQIEFARQHGLPTLAGPTVAKLVSGIRVTLDHACDPLRLIKANPAAAVKVKGAKSDSDARLPFSPEDLRLIFSDPILTDPSHPSPYAFFWLLLLAILTGMRIEEMGKLRPSNVRCERGIWYIAVERDSRRVRKERTASGETNKVGKTEAAYRHIGLHWLLIEAGFVDFARKQEEAGHAWLFPDLAEDKYGSRTKEASRELIRHFRSLGILDEEKVFHSFRHSMKHACRNTSMKEEIADLLAGHAPATIGRKYGAGAALAVLRDAVDLIEYETIDWDPIIKAARGRLARLEQTP